VFSPINASARATEIELATDEGRVLTVRYRSLSADVFTPVMNRLAVNLTTTAAAMEVQGLLMHSNV
jgi:hypothetical protein